MTGGGYDPARPLALMHVPKSLGTSLTEALAGAVAPRRSVTGFDGVLFGGFDAFDTLDAATRAEIFHTPEALPDADLIAGHFSRFTIGARYPHAQTITVLRDPISRLLSFWLYWRGHLDAQLVGWGAWGDMVRLSRLDLATFLRDPRLACQNDNQVVRMLLWPHALIPADGFIAEAHDATVLAEAIGRLATFDLVALAEDGDLVKRLQDWLGRPFVLGHRNETGSIPAHLRSPLEHEMTPEALELLTKCSRLDQQLWLETARRHLPDSAAAHLAESSRLINVARFAGLMARPAE